MDWGRNSPVCAPRAKHKLTVSAHLSKEPMNTSARMFIGLCGRYSQAIKLPKFANFFFVLFLFGKEKEHRKTKFKTKLP